MERSKILDNLIESEVRISVKALSAERKPLSLDALLIDYDNDGFLYRGKKSGDNVESAYYIPRSAVASMRFNIDDLQPVNLEGKVDQSNSTNEQEIVQQKRKQPFIECLGETIDYMKNELKMNTESNVDLLEVVRSGINKVKGNIRWSSYKLLYTQRKDGVTGYVPGLVHALRVLIDQKPEGLGLLYQDRELSSESCDIDNQLKSLVIEALPRKEDYGTRREFGPLDNVSPKLKEFIKYRIEGND